ncbi:MAG TPA: hypothetical protein VK889_04270 [Solirubrobacterales bacterium]|nr:hypothetical protein [Solirubrobacterales bacterium]
MTAKKTALTALLALVSVLGLAASAQANWTHKGKGELKENASLVLAGALTVSTSAGDVSCPVTIETTLTASSSSGHVSSFAVAKPSECDLGGSLGAICGTHGVTKVEPTGTWALAADEADLTLSAIDVHYVMAGCLIPSFRLKGSATASLDKATAISTATLSGTQTLYNAAGEEAGTGELKGTLSATPAATYGVKTGATVETRWTDANAHLSGDGKLTLAGTFSFSGSGGSVSCPATVKLQLFSATVEEEEPEGEIESFTVSKASECDLGGGYKTSCGTNGLASVERTGTATLTATESDVAVAGLVLDYKFEKCPITSLRVEGDPTISVNNPEAIGSATFSAGALEIYNAAEEAVGTAEAGGSATASPGGTFQLVEEEPVEEGESWWTTDPGGEVLPGPENPTTFTGSGELSSTRGFTTGPAEVHLHGFLWNGPEHGEGVIDVFEITVPEGGIPTTLPGCTVTGATNTTEIGAEWSLTLETEAESAIEISGITFTNHYSKFCQETYKLPATVPVSGEATGTYNNETGCIEFENDEGLAVEGTEGTLVFATNGTVCIHEEGGSFTANG